jgi:glycine/D-amino acid oxidase-like deaminating enzyme
MSSSPNLSTSFRNGNISFWVDSVGEPQRRPGLPGSCEVDVAIVGAGMTGLWSAYYLKKARPDWEIVVLEKEFAGFGASGRNGGWLSGKSMGLARHYEARGGHDGAVQLQREMFHTVDEALRVANEEGFGEGVQKDGLMHVATNPAQLSRLRAELTAMRDEGWGADDVVELTPAELSSRVNVEGALGGYWTPHCARIHPAEFVFGLANAVERLGVHIYEKTTVSHIAPHRVVTNRGEVSAKFVVQALEGYTCTLDNKKRRLLPMNSSMVVTEPLSRDVSESIGWNGAELLGDMAHSFAYIQRTADNRIALGGRAVPYNYASSFKRDGKTAPKAIGQLSERLLELFPALKNTQLAHTWSGVLGVPRDWTAGVSIDHRAGVVEAGGYVGHGVAGTNLSGRTVCDLVLGEDTELTRLPWVGHRARNWEIEPIRWLGATTLYALYRFADRDEYGRQKPKTSLAARVGNIMSGRY